MWGCNRVNVCANILKAESRKTSLLDFFAEAHLILLNIGKFLVRMSTETQRHGVFNLFESYFF